MGACYVQCTVHTCVNAYMNDTFDKFCVFRARKPTPMKVGGPDDPVSQIASDTIS